jgi:hypothetical protein
VRERERDLPNDESYLSKDFWTSSSPALADARSREGFHTVHTCLGVAWVLVRSGESKDDQKIRIKEREKLDVVID